MKTKIIVVSILLLLVVVFVCGCSQFMENIGLVSPTNEEQLSLEKGGPPDGLVKVLIGFKEKPGPVEQAIVKGAGGKIKYTYNLIPAIAASVPEAAIEALKKNPNIINVELDSMVYALDTELDNSWGVKRIGAGIVHESESGNKGAGVKIAVIDTGIDYTHPDLDDNYIGGYDWVNGDDDPMDDDGHGTHVAGIIAAEDNGVGVVGVAPEVKLYALKALDETGSGYVSDVVMAIQWATVNGIQIINMSLGGSANLFLEAACLLAYYQDGLILVAAAGNSGNPPGKGDNIIYPAGYESVIAVGATNQSDERTRWSSTGSALELVAPGGDVYSTYLGDYTTMSGTSMSSPHVTGTAALVWVKNPTWSNDEVRAQLQNSADDLGAIGWDSKFGYGLVNAAAAVGLTGEEPEEPTEPATGNMHVFSIDMSFNEATAGPNKFYTAVATVTIVDASDIPVEGATVSSSWSGATDDTDSGVTNADGKVILQSNKLKNPSSGTTFAFTIENVSKDGWTYDPGANEETSDSISI
ncbi:MAG: S8 family serine peptidase [Candidatus Bathyarchaeota archaeon]|nr:S8 family serine peptidase [Candidatus Bathyarchaeota archaeon]